MTRDEVHAILLRQMRAWRDGDPEAILAGYAPDAVLRAPGVRLDGRGELREGIARYLAEYVDIDIELTRLVVEGERGALEWTWSETRRADGRRRRVDDAIVFVLRDGLIVSWREYVDAAGPD